MSKAYDRVEWPFLEGIMRQFGFAEEFVKLVMKCVSTVSYRFNVNGDISDVVIPGRGLRQVDPISPYLFLLCAEGLSAMLIKTDEENRIKGIKLAPNAPRVNHLMFVDDSLLVVEASLQSVQTINAILQTYEECSGQVINLEKSSVMFSANASQSFKNLILQELQLGSEATGGKYLGLPSYVGKSKKECFAYIRDRIVGRLDGGLVRLLSMAGKEV